ncbi:alpha/beta hydrolase [Bacillus gobiensis]|uniref:Alpha/beta hydrolase n=1 Tax=Bacillus gobiensis TaxID=1441095 RepID=A0A0M3RAR2_9BACI|nr:alpha/beta hydrolase [Bacillus gobiensis]
MLCGTLPIGIDIEGSDLDIIMEVNDFNRFENRVITLFGDRENFKLKRVVIRNIPVIKANFLLEGFEFELFGQPQPSNRQYAYLHMIIENAIMEKCPSIREKVINLKKQGFKTEPAFCTVLRLDGDPYEKLIEYGKANGMID